MFEEKSQQYFLAYLEEYKENKVLKKQMVQHNLELMNLNL